MTWLGTAFRFVILLSLLASWIGMLIPAFPAPTVMWALTLLYGLSAGFGTLGAVCFGVITVLTIFSWFVDNILGLAGARKGGAQGWSLLIAPAVGLVTSILLTPIVGILLTGLSLFLLEWHLKKDWRLAWHATRAMLIGWGSAVAVRLVIGALIIALWAIWAWH